MHILFVCQGNTYRSRMAEAYARSLNAENVTISSCGLKASRNLNGPIAWYALRSLIKQGMANQLCPHWTQLTQSHLDGADYTIFMHGKVAEACAVDYSLDKRRNESWDIEDVNYQFTDQEMIGHADCALDRIRNKTDLLFARLGIQPHTDTANNRLALEAVEIAEKLRDAPQRKFLKEARIAAEG